MAWLNRLDAAIARSLGSEAAVDNAVEDPVDTSGALADSTAADSTSLSATEHAALTASFQGSESEDKVTEPVDTVDSLEAPTNATHVWIPEVVASDSSDAGMSFAECCAVCYDAWPPADSTVNSRVAVDMAPNTTSSSSASTVVAAIPSKLFKCQTCRRRCHRACCDFAARVLPCDATCDESLPPPLPEGANRPGCLRIQVLAATVEASHTPGGASAAATRRLRVRANATLLPAPLQGESEQWVSPETEAATENGTLRASWTSTNDLAGATRGTLNHGIPTTAKAASGSSHSSAVALPEPTLRVVLEACHITSSTASCDDINNGETQPASTIDDAWAPMGAPIDLPLMPLLGCPNHELRRWFANYDGQGSTQVQLLLSFEPTVPSAVGSVEINTAAVGALAPPAPLVSAPGPADVDAAAHDAVVADTAVSPSSNELASLEPPVLPLPPASSPVREKPLPSLAADIRYLEQAQAQAPGSPPFSPMSGYPHHYGHQSGGGHAPHWFRVTTLKKPGWCALCRRLLVGVWRQGHACERCGLLVHRACQQQAHLDLPCGSHQSTAAAAGTADASAIINMSGNDDGSQKSDSTEYVASGSANMAHTSGASPGASIPTDHASATVNQSSHQQSSDTSPRRQLFAASDDGNGRSSRSSGGGGNATTNNKRVAPSGNPWSGIGEVSLEVVCAHQCSARCDAPFSWLASARHARHLGLTSAFVSPRRCQAVVQEAQAAAARNLLQPNGHKRPAAAAAGDLVGTATSGGSIAAPALSAAGVSATENSNNISSDAVRAAAAAAEVTAAAAAMDLAHGIPTRCPCPGSDLFLRFYMGGEEAGRTATTYGKRTCRPQRNERQRHFAAPHGRATFAVHLIDAATDRAVGVFEVPVLKLLQRECDAASEGWAHTLDATLDLPLFSTNALDPKPWPAGTATATSAATAAPPPVPPPQDSNRHNGDGHGDGDELNGGNAAPTAAATGGGGGTGGAAPRAGANPREALVANVVGFVRVRKLRFHEAADLFWDGHSAPWDVDYLFPPRPCPNAPPEDFSVATFQRHIARANAIIGWFGAGWDAYQRLINWERKGESALALACFVAGCLGVDAERAPAVPALLLVWHLSSGFLSRQTGGYSGYWLEEAPSTARAFALGPATTPPALPPASSGASADAAVNSSRAIEGQDSMGNPSSDAGATSRDEHSAATPSGRVDSDDGFTPLAVLRVAVLQGKNLGLRRKRLATKQSQTKGTLRTKKDSSEGSNRSDSAHGTHPSSVTSSGLDSTEDVDLSNHLKDSSSSSSNFGATHFATPSENTYVARPTRYYVRVSYMPGEFAALHKGTATTSASSSPSAATTTSGAAAPPGGGELFIGHTRYSARSHNPIWVDRNEDLSSGRNDDHDGDKNSEHMSNSSHHGGGDRRRGGGSSRRSARGSVALLGTLLDALLPSEDGRLRGGGEFGDGSDNETDGRTVHSIKRRWPRSIPSHLQRTTKSSNGKEEHLDESSNGSSQQHSSYLGDGDESFFYHILQPRRPIVTKSQRSINASSSKGSLVPWTEAPGAVRLRVLAESGLDAMVDQGPIMDDAIMFECIVPISRLVNSSHASPAGAQPELELWFLAQWPPPQGSLPIIPQHLPTSAPSPYGTTAEGTTSDSATAFEQMAAAETHGGGYGPRSDSSSHGTGSTAESSSDLRNNRTEAAMVKVRLQLVLREHNAAATETADDREVAHAVERAVNTALAAQAYEHVVTAARAASKRSRKQKQKLIQKQKNQPFQKQEQQKRQQRQVVTTSTIVNLETAESSPGRANNFEGYPNEANEKGAPVESDSSHDDKDVEDDDSSSSSDDSTGGGSGSSKTRRSGRSSRANGSMVPGLGGAVHRRALALLPTGRLDSDWVEGAFGSVTGLDTASGGGGTLQTLLGVRETLTSVQNGLGDAVEMCERIKNLLNWTHPQRTRLVLAAATLVLVVLVVAPFRYLLLAGGVFEFTKVWLLGDGGGGDSGGSKLKPPPSPVPQASSSVDDTTNPEENADGKKAPNAAASAASTSPAPPPAPKKGFLLDNMLATLPSDETLRLSYAHEAKYLAALKEDARRARRRRARLRVLCGASWDGAVVRVGMQGTIRTGVSARNLLGASAAGGSSGVGNSGSGGVLGGDGGLGSLGVGAADSLGLSTSTGLGGGSGGGGDAVWLRGGFAVLQGRRLLWWQSEAALESGQPADAFLRLRGHAGVTAPSPSDLRTAGCAAGCIAAVFASEPAGLQGRTTNRQRWALVFADETERRAFTASIENALGKEE